MKFSKRCIALIIVSMSFASIFAQELGDKIYKDVTINGKGTSRLVKYEYFYEMNPEGKQIHYKDINGDEIWDEYDLKGNLIWRKGTVDSERWYECYNYDEKGNKIYYKIDTAYEYKESWYDAHGNIIHEKHKNGEEHWYEYDSNGNMVHDKTNLHNEGGGTCIETWNEYDSTGNLIHSKGYGWEHWYKYDSNGNVIYEIDAYGNEGFYEYEYDSNDNKIYEKDRFGYETWWNSNGKLIHHKTNEKADWEEWYEYNSKGDMIYNKVKHNGKIIEKFHEYIYWENGNLKKVNVFSAS